MSKKNANPNVSADDILSAEAIIKEKVKNGNLLTAEELKMAAIFKIKVPNSFGMRFARAIVRDGKFDEKGNFILPNLDNYQDPDVFATTIGELKNTVTNWKKWLPILVTAINEKRQDV